MVRSRPAPVAPEPGRRVVVAGGYGRMLDEDLDDVAAKALKRLRKWSHADSVVAEIGAAAFGRERAIRSNVLPRLAARGLAKRQAGGLYRYTGA